ncbi:hypothetical protein BJ875DRAFT_136773 [Amylocarpus encephaloides]|uniref:Uncharacterized protein n=1 Tax=Amylocarpus encephaloides TaxID=45428 RepID=A0A9P7YQ52_9HELO|nr:hypothetical protein BJ875DRAFT_136773 [Amylocarpus encephaloides]
MKLEWSRAPCSLCCVELLGFVRCMNASAERYSTRSGTEEEIEFPGASEISNVDSQSHSTVALLGGCPAASSRGSTSLHGTYSSLCVFKLPQAYERATDARKPPYPCFPGSLVVDESLWSATCETFDSLLDHRHRLHGSPDVKIPELRRTTGRTRWNLSLGC